MLFSIESNQNIALLFVCQTLVFSNPRLLSSFVSTAFEDVLSGLPTSRVTLLAPVKPVGGTGQTGLPKVSRVLIVLTIVRAF